MTRTIRFASLVLTGLALTACGGGGGSGGSSTGTTPPPPLQGTISGTATKGPVNGGSVTAYAINAGAMGAQVASTKTDAQGNFTLAMGSYSGPVMLQMSGGTYTDEATGSSMTMMAGDVMTAVLPTMTAGAAVSGIQMTALTSMAQAMAQHLSGGMTDANITTANTNVGKYFMVGDILHTVPMNPLVPGSGNTASQDAMNYGLCLAAMSQYAKTLGMSSSSAMVTAMMNDAADGMMDGRQSGSAVMMGGMGAGTMMRSTAGTSDLATAMAAFMATTQNKSGVTAASMQTLMSQLMGSNGQMMGGATPTNGMISGQVFNGPMGQATVMAYALSGGTRGAQIGSTTTDAQGAFTMSVGSYAGPVMLQVSGGAYTDEATGRSMTMGSTDVMTSVMPTMAAGSSVSGVWITPMTSMAQARAQGMSGGMTDANINAANAAIGNYCMVGDIAHTPPMNPLVPGSGSSASQDQRDYGMCIAAMSQYAKDQGMTNSSAMITAMMNDASDGRMDGRMGTGQISMGGGMMGGGMMQPGAGTTGMATSMTTFVGSSMNMSGLTAADMNALIQKMASSNGQL